MLVETCIGQSPYIMRINDMDDEFVRDVIETLIADDEPGGLGVCICATDLASIAAVYTRMHMIGTDMFDGKLRRIVSCNRDGVRQIQRLLKKEGFMVSGIVPADIVDVADMKMRG